MKIKINDETKNILVDKITIKGLMQSQKIKDIDIITVQLNGEFVDRDNFDSISLKENDEVDFLYFMGGGNL